ncbi:MAG: radical SAM protein, partial [Bacteroidales bacterium]|nr:radical SAM protein [Bacteroidales bacterium]
MSKAAFITLGCKLNFSETSTLARQFAAQGFEEVPPGPDVDIVVINTCSVTEHADKKCRNLIRRLHKQAPKAKIAVTGCYAQLKPLEILAIDGVDLVVGADRKGDLVRLALAADKGKQGYSCEINEVESFFPAYSSGERTRSFLKVQDGCDYHCAYCTVPLARGNSRNIPIPAIVAQAREIAAQGIIEVVLTGVNTGDFGKTTGESFLDLLKALNDVPGIERYRISSIEPNLLTEEILRWIA